MRVGPARVSMRFQSRDRGHHLHMGADWERGLAVFRRLVAVIALFAVLALVFLLVFGSGQ
jgi:hypothetical protein